MYDTILVPLDGSDRAEAILGHVERLAECFGSKIIFLRVVDPPIMVGAPGEATMARQIDSLYKQAQEDAENYLKGVRGEFRQKGLRAEMRVMQGPVTEAIVNASCADNIDLIAMASHGRGGLGSMIYGSVAAGVLHKADRPMLVVRSPMNV
jgi:nucleotide-binding universal stress UspA family protein